ncbi:MAG: ABC transporter permease [Bacteroidota bacterium]
MLRLLRAEALVLGKDRALRLAALGFLGAPLMVAFMFLFGRAELVKHGSWHAADFFGQATIMLALLLGPMMLAVAGAQLITLEYKQKTLKGLLPLPASLPGLFAAKTLLGSALLGAALLLTAGVTALAPALLGIPPAWPQILDLLRDMAVVWVSFLAFMLFAMLVSLVSKNFVAPLAASAVALVGGILALQGGKGQYFWTAIPMMLVGGKEKLANLAPRLLTSLSYAALFLAAGLLWAGTTRRPE